MGPFSVGQVVFLPFPFSDLSRRKLRPVLLLANAGRKDWIVCQITSNPFADRYSVVLTQDAFLSGGLKRVSYARPNKLFMANESLIASNVGSLKVVTLEVLRDAVIAILRNAPTFSQ